jgi:hypothetical protein
VTDDNTAVSGFDAGYVPCPDLASAEPATNDNGTAVSGFEEGYVAVGDLGAAEPTISDNGEAVSGFSEGYVANPCGPAGPCDPVIDFDTFDDRTIAEPTWPAVGDWGDASSGPAWHTNVLTPGDGRGWVDGGWGIIDQHEFADFEDVMRHFSLSAGPWAGVTDFTLLMRVKWTRNIPLAHMTNQVGLWWKIEGTIGGSGLVFLAEEFVQDDGNHSFPVPIFDDTVYLFRWDYTPNADGHSRTTFWPEAGSEPSICYSSRLLSPTIPGSVSSYLFFGIWARGPGLGDVSPGPRMSVDWIKFMFCPPPSCT